MKTRLAAFGLVALIVSAFIWCSRPSRTGAPAGLNIATGTNSPSEETQSRARATALTAKASDSSSAEESVAGKAPRAVDAGAAETTPAADAAPSISPITVMENMRGMFRNYHSRFGGNPVGDNLEITQTLNGANPAHAIFLQPEDGVRLDEKGALIDEWGTPYFFHQLSGAEMEIHSAGPDRKMWTADDLVIR